MSLLSLVQDVCLNVGVDNGGQQYTAAIGGDFTVQQMVAFAQVAGDELSRAYDWQALKQTATITGDGVTTDWDFPTDFERFPNLEVQWDSKYPAIPLGGAVSDEEWGAITSLQVQPQRPVWRIFQNKFITYPALSVGEVVSTQYITSNWITSADGTTGRTRWQSDTDVSLIEERLLVLDVIWRWKRSKGFDYAEEFRTAQSAIQRAAGQDHGPRTIYTSRGIGTNILGTNPFNPIVSVS